MDLERFQAFVLQSIARNEAAAARHDAEVAVIRELQKGTQELLKATQESLKSLASTTERLVDNQVFLQDSMGELKDNIKELERIVFRHVTDPGAHNLA